MTLTTKEAKAELARILGEDVDRIETTNPRWLTMMQEGVIVKLHIRRWRARAKLSLSDLGLTLADTDADEKKAFAELLQLGEKRLLPLELLRQLESCESAGRKALETAGYSTYYGTFIPASNYANWRTENDALAERYLEIGRKIVASFDQWREDLLAAYRTQARIAYRRMQALDPAAMTSEERWDEALFVAGFAARVERLIPAPATIAEGYGWETELSYIPLPSLLAADRLEEERVRMEQDELWARVSIEDDALRSRQQALRTMNADIVDKARREKETLVGGFLKDVVVQLRSMVYDVTTNVMATMQNNDGNLHGRSVVQLRNLIENVERLNFQDDAEIKAMLAQVKAVTASATERDATNIADKLRDVATVTRASLIALGETPRIARGLPDVTPANDLFAARRRLALPALDEADEPVLLAPTRRQVVEM